MGMKRKTFRYNLITYGIVIGAFILVQALLSAGRLSSLMSGLLVPICTYVVLAISLNLVVGISGELSLGHAGFMCVGAFAGAFLATTLTVSHCFLLVVLIFMCVVLSSVSLEGASLLLHRLRRAYFE